MKKNKKIKSLKKIIIFLIIIVLVILIALLIMLNKKSRNEEDKTQEEIEQQITQAQEDFLLTKNEKERMQIYLTRYLNYIENNEYEQAYNLLYEDFRNLYYPTLSFFEKYVNETYFSAMQVEYEDIQRQGEYFILTVELIDMLEPLRTKVQKFVIYEKDVNDFVLSFQAQ